MTTERTKQQVAVITGAASGIGAALARAAVSRGMAVVLADYERKALAGLADALGPLGHPCATDVRDPVQVEALADFAFERFGRVDLLFNNAGVIASGQSWRIDPTEWARVIDINVMGVVNGINAFVPRLLAAGKPARIVNTGSVGGFFVGPRLAPYAASKFAVAALTEALALELAELDSGVFVSLLIPGAVRTAITEGAAAAGDDTTLKGLRRLAEKRGLDADDFAEATFSGIDAGQFWIVPQPEALDERLAARTKMILDRRSPVAANLGKAQWPKPISSTPCARPSDARKAASPTSTRPTSARTRSKR